MTKKPEVVFFYGPPFSGKALFFKHHFSQTHKKINPAELFEATPSLSHREVILKVVNTLNEGHSVVVDDENSSKIKRKSYMAIIRKKVGLCNFRVIISILHLLLAFLSVIGPESGNWLVSLSFH